MNRKKPSNAGLKLASLLLAVLLWFIMVNVADPVATKIFTQVPVTTQNESVLTNLGQVYQIQGGNVVTVTVKAKRSTLAKLTKDDIEAVADFSNMQLDSMVPVIVTIPSQEGRYESAEALPRNMQISVEANASATLPISVNTTGSVKEGYFIESTVADPSSVTVSGPKSLVDSIKSVTVNADVSQFSESAEVTGNARFFDGDGMPVDDTLLTLDQAESGVKIKVNVIPVKEVEVIPLYTGVPAEHYELVELTSEPKVIRVVGKSDVLDTFEVLELPAEIMDLTDAKENITTVVDLADYLPDGISLADGQSDKLMLTALIEQSGTKTVNYPVGSIVVKDAPEGCKISYDGISEINLNFRGHQSELEELVPDIIDVSIDLKEIDKPGKYEVPVIVEPQNNCVLVNEIIVNITLEEE